jgi:hypothetical protein
MAFPVIDRQIEIKLNLCAAHDEMVSTAQLCCCCGYSRGGSINREFVLLSRWHRD